MKRSGSCTCIEKALAFKNNVPFLSVESVDKIMSHDGLVEIRESLSNDDGNGNRNSKKES